jgi:dTDP-4-dehydrorhamnose reductase
MKILVLGATGMLGNAVLRLLAQDTSREVTGTCRAARPPEQLARWPGLHWQTGVDVEQPDSLVAAFAQSRPQVVVNCVGLVKQLPQSNSPLAAVPINTLLPHRLAALSGATGARLVHISTDCVFSGARGGYRESDFPDADDLYGRSKLLGEVDYPHAITLRTSIIGHELSSQHGLVAWFLAQQGQVKGFRRAVFSGLPTVELARVIGDVVLPRPELHGVYHVGSAPIDKFSLLRLVAAAYGKEIEIIPDDNLVIDRSLDSGRFKAATGYQAATWPALVGAMREFG